MNLEQIAEQFAACVPIIGMTNDIVPHAYLKIIVGVMTAFIVGAGAGLTAITLNNDKSSAVIIQKLDGIEKLYNAEISGIKDRLAKLEGGK